MLSTVLAIIAVCLGTLALGLAIVALARRPARRPQLGSGAYTALPAQAEPQRVRHHDTARYRFSDVATRRMHAPDLDPALEPKPCECCGQPRRNKQ